MMKSDHGAALLIGLAPKGAGKMKREEKDDEPEDDFDQEAYDAASGEAMDAIKSDDRKAFGTAMRSMLEIMYSEWMR